MKKTIIFIVLIILHLLIISCSKKAQYKISDEMPQVSEEKSYAGTSDRLKETNKEAPVENEKDVITTESIRKIIKNATVYFQVNDLKGIDKKVQSAVLSYNGYISSLNYSISSLNIVAKIPSDKFDSFINESSKIGKVVSKSVSAEDVTRNYYDLEGRLKNKKAYQSWLRDQYAKARTIDDVLKFSRELNNVTESIESVEGEFKNLSNLIEFSTINLIFNLPVADSITFKHWPNVKKDLSNLLYYITMFFYTLVKIIIWIIIVIIALSLVLIPVILAGGFLYMLSFGKIGLVKKYFKTLSGSK
ncbi:MAG: DUF4349 domain-containing protein [Spirochaetes bacterium]|nr:DUF4349 domain-containing protein [Spirochaetota bacterium]